MIPLYTIIVLNVFGALEVLLPLLFLYFLRRYKKYSISSADAEELDDISSQIMT